MRRLHWSKRSRLALLAALIGRHGVIFMSDSYYWQGSLFMSDGGCLFSFVNFDSVGALWRMNGGNTSCTGVIHSNDQVEIQD